MKESILFTSEGTEAPKEWYEDALAVSDYISGYFDGIGQTEASPPGLPTLFRAIQNLDAVLRANVRINDPSIFKRAAAFCIGFMMESPISQSFDDNQVGKRIANIPNHANALVAFEYVRYSLWGAEIFRECETGGSEIVPLRNPIAVS